MPSHTLPSDDPAAPPAGPRPLWVLLPLALAFLQVAGTWGASHRQEDSRALDVLAFVLVLVGPAALVVAGHAPPRSRGVSAAGTGVDPTGRAAPPGGARWHRYVLPSAVVTVGLATAVYLLRGYAYGPVFASLAVAVVLAVVRGYRPAALVAIALTAVGVISARFLGDHPWSWWWALGSASWALVLVGAGELIRANRARAAEARRARAEEQRRRASEDQLRVARELHDVVAHHMSLINVQAGVALHLVDRRPEQVEVALRTIKDASKEALTELRDLIGVLRADGEQAPRAPAATLAGLDEVVRRTSQAGVTATVHRTGTVDALPPAVDAAAFRIVQEAVTNVVRHSGATRTVIALDVAAGHLTLTVTDNGRGVGAAEPGNGLRGMRERAAALGGAVELTDEPGGGARLRATLPLHPEEGTT